MSKKAMKLATEFNRYFTGMNGVDVPERVSVPRDEWRALFAALAEQPAQGCDHCNHALYSGTKCKNCGRVTEQAAIKRDLTPEQPAPVQQEPVLVVEVEPDYMSSGHHHKGSKPYISLKKLWSIPIGTKLYTSPQPAQRKTLT